MVASPVRDRHTHSGVSSYQHATILLHRHTRDGTISDVKNTDLIEDQRTRVALYVRVSLDRREKASVEEQLADLRLTVDRLGWDIVAEAQVVRLARGLRDRIAGLSHRLPP